MDFKVASALDPTIGRERTPRLDLRAGAEVTGISPKMAKIPARRYRATNRISRAIHARFHEEREGLINFHIRELTRVQDKSRQ